MNILEKPFNTGFKYPEVFLFLLASTYFLPFLGVNHLFDWDEINFAESTREMMVTGDYFRVRVNFQPFWEKPPLFFWLQVLAMKAFGINEFAARLPNAICGIVTLLVFFRIGRRLIGQSFGMLWAVLYTASLLPHLYFKSGIIDPIFNLFIFLGLYYLILLIEEEGEGSIRKSVLAGFFTGLAVLTKGPVGLLIVLLTFMTYWAFRRFKKVASFQSVLIYALTVFVVSSAWFGYETVKNGPWFLLEFVQYQIDLFSQPVAGHKQPFYYHFVVVLFGCFPMSVFAIRNLWKSELDTQIRYNFSGWMRYLFWVVMILFTVVTTKIVHYSSMAYIPLSFLAAYQVQDWIQKEVAPPKWQLIFNLVVGLVVGLIITAIPVLMITKEKWISMISDKMTVASLDQEVKLNGWEWMIGLIFILSVLEGYRLFSQGKHRVGIMLSSISLGVCLMVFSLFILPGIEQYSQGPAIAFYKELQGKDVYIHTYRFKSYADYFYSRKTPVREEALSGAWLMSGPIDKPVYVVCKVRRMHRMEEFPDFDLLYQEGGFAFYLRNP